MDTNVAELARSASLSDEADNLHMLLPKIREVLSTLGTTHQVYVIDGGSEDDTVSVAESLGAVVIRQRGGGYGGAIRTAFEDIRATWLLTMDADFSHHPVFIKYCSRGAMKGKSSSRRAMPHRVTGRCPGAESAELYPEPGIRLILSLNVRDLSSGFRLYHRNAISKLDCSMKPMPCSRRS